jgi:hypothetical protein
LVASVAQLVEQLTLNQLVHGSSPCRGTIFPLYYRAGYVGEAHVSFAKSGQASDLPRKVIIGQQDTETIAHIVLKLFAFILFYRPRLQLEIDLQRDTFAFVPDLVELDYQMRPQLWIECGECSMNKLHKLAVKLPDTEFWVVKRSEHAARDLLRAMEKEEFAAIVIQSWAWTWRCSTKSAI